MSDKCILEIKVRHFEAQLYGCHIHDVSIEYPRVCLVIGLLQQMRLYIRALAKILWCGVELCIQSRQTDVISP